MPVLSRPTARLASVREQRIILPQSDNHGASLGAVALELEALLASRFGGFSKMEGWGGWDSPGGTVRERVWIYDVASPATQKNRDVLRGIAVWLCRQALQQCIYTRYDNGIVELVSAETPAAVAA